MRPIPEAHRTLYPRVVAPDFLAARWIECDHDAVRRTQEQLVVDLDRRVLVGGFGRVAGSWLVAGFVSPGHLQLSGIGRRDLGERRVALAQLRAAIVGPVARLPVRLASERRGGRFRCAHLDVTRLVIRRIERGNEAKQDRQHDSGCQRHDTFAGHGRRPENELARDGRHKQPEPEHEPQPQAWQQLPEVEARLDDRPDHRREQDQREQQQRSAPTHPQEEGSRRDAHTRQHVVPRAAQHGEPDAARQQREPDAQQNDRWYGQRGGQAVTTRRLHGENLDERVGRSAGRKG
ncbi:hypothetical protein [Paraburkholderia sp. DGU8]|uniref:hypothetical protein n=1 Tax=Paraburkholderia sp. DGU8 TaxID=3161997 RepID=UPI00346734A0